METIEFTLSHDGENWVCVNNKFEISGKDFHELDTNIITELRKNHSYESNIEVNIFMKFDFDQFPTWLRQYQAHYFNREVTLNL